MIKKLILVLLQQVSFMVINIKNGEFHINENEAPAVRLMFEMYLSNKTYNEIIDEVEKHKVTK